MINYHFGSASLQAEAAVKGVEAREGGIAEALKRASRVLERFLFVGTSFREKLVGVADKLFLNGDGQHIAQG